MSTSLRTLMSIAAAATLLAAPAMAKPRMHHHAVPRDAYAERAPYVAVPNPQYRADWTVTWPNQRAVAGDPDINIRFEMLRDHNFGLGGGGGDGR
jgi:hypothetical protein